MSQLDRVKTGSLLRRQGSIKFFSAPLLTQLENSAVAVFTSLQAFATESKSNSSPAEILAYSAKTALQAMQALSNQMKTAAESLPDDLKIEMLSHAKSIIDLSRAMGGAMKECLKAAQGNPQQRSQAYEALLPLVEQVNMLLNEVAPMPAHKVDPSHVDMVMDHAVPSGLDTSPGMSTMHPPTSPSTPPLQRVGSLEEMPQTPLSPSSSRPSISSPFAPPSVVKLASEQAAQSTPAQSTPTSPPPNLQLFSRAIQTSLSAFASMVEEAGTLTASNTPVISGLKSALEMVKQFVVGVKAVAADPAHEEGLRRSLMMSATAIIQASADLAQALRTAIKASTGTAEEAVEANLALRNRIRGIISLVSTSVVHLFSSTDSAESKETQSDSQSVAASASSVSSETPIPEPPPAPAPPTFELSMTSSTDFAPPPPPPPPPVLVGDDFEPAAADQLPPPPVAAPKTTMEEPPSLDDLPAPPPPPPMPELDGPLPDISSMALPPPPPSLNELVGMLPPPPPIPAPVLELSANDSPTLSTKSLPPPPPPRAKFDISNLPLMKSVKAVQDSIGQLCGSMSVLSIGFGGGSSQSSYYQMLKQLEAVVEEFSTEANNALALLAKNDEITNGLRARLHLTANQVRNGAVQVVSTTRATLFGMKPVTGTSSSTKKFSESVRLQQLKATTTLVTLGLQQMDSARKNVAAAVKELRQSYEGYYDLLAKRDQASAHKALEAQEEKIDLWDVLKPDSNDTIRFTEEIDDTQGHAIECATLPKLIERLTHERFSGHTFTQIFITTCQSFTTPNTLLDLLIQRYVVPEKVFERLPKKVDLGEFRKSTILPIQLRVGTSLKYWIEHRFQDFDDDLVAQLQTFVGGPVTENSKGLATQLGNAIAKQIQRRDEGTLSARMKIKSLSMANIPEQGFMPINVMQGYFDLAEIARQITLHDFFLYRSIEPVELLNQAWNKPKYRWRAPNVIALVERFNQLSSWVATIILWQTSLAERRKMVARVIELNIHFHKLKNFHAIAAVNAGLNNSSLHRLKYTMEGIDKKLKESQSKLEHLMNPDGSYKNYREMVHKVSPPLLPFIGVYLRDLVFIEDGNPDMLNGNLINFQKRRYAFNVIAEIQQYQQDLYPFPFAEPLYSFLAQLPTETDDDLYNLSIECEPRNATLKEVLEREKAYY
eukprot:TRINITY_DN5087_c0_g1_i3.p1 TRINITY_DN5087_c0_g1~~TRINITY_DN5087_c0_g1_i3.p1  ORF type:complete len:1169 (+),score=295.43 TRINITY_DN5087_c0_g1_i3:53-3559(+)